MSRLTRNDSCMSITNTTRREEKTGDREMLPPPPPSPSPAGYPKEDVISTDKASNSPRDTYASVLRTTSSPSTSLPGGDVKQTNTQDQARNNTNTTNQQSSPGKCNKSGIHKNSKPTNAEKSLMLSIPSRSSSSSSSSITRSSASSSSSSSSYSGSSSSYSGSSSTKVSKKKTHSPPVHPIFQTRKHKRYIDDYLRSREYGTLFLTRFCECRNFVFFGSQALIPHAQELRDAIPNALWFYDVFPPSLMLAMGMTGFSKGKKGQGRKGKMGVDSNMLRVAVWMLASAVRGTAYIVLDPEDSFKTPMDWENDDEDENVWLHIILPCLTHSSGHVDRIVRVDSDNFSNWSVAWERGQAEALRLKASRPTELSIVDHHCTPKLGFWTGYTGPIYRSPCGCESCAHCLGGTLGKRGLGEYITWRMEHRLAIACGNEWSITVPDAFRGMEGYQFSAVFLQGKWMVQLANRPRV